ncbi:BTB/POZ domain-containing protein 2 [Aphelenchoides avenae]|nr:BTB/POZ domain-containing protein 2 [Aphelenchus avenae]
MFYGSFDTPQTIVLEGCTAEAWQCIMKHAMLIFSQVVMPLLRYIYLDEIAIEMEDSYYVLFFSKQYMLHRLFEQTVQFVKSKMTVQNVCSILPSLIVFDELKESMLEFADKNADAVLRSDGFCGLPHEVMLATISRDSLVIREIVLYDSVVKWAKAALERESKEVIPENIRSCLGDALHSIRFPLMTLEEFSKGPAVSGILTSEECVAIFLWFGSKTVPEKFHVAVRKGENGSGNRRCRYCNTWMHSVHGYSTCNHCGRSF